MRPLLAFIMAILLIVGGCDSSNKSPDLPVISSINVSKATYGGAITISGNFLKTVDKVFFGNSLSATPSSVAENEVSVIIPKMIVGPTELWVQSYEGKSNKLSLEILEPIATITSITPNQAKRGETVVISGENLDLITTVRFNNDSSSAANFTLEENSLKVVVPQDAVSGIVWVSNSEGKSPSPQIFTLLIEPEIISLSSNRGVENKEIEIRGKYLENALVYFESLMVNVISNSGSSIKVKCPKFSQVKNIEITIKTIGGEVKSIFTGAPAATISKAIPNGLIPGSSLTLKGTNFFNIQSILLPNGKKINQTEFIAIDADHVTIKLPYELLTGKVQIENQYGYGEPLSLEMITAGEGLNADNIANGNIGIGSLGGISRLCNPVIIKEFNIAYYPGNLNNSEQYFPNNPLFSDVFSGILYSICYCNSDCGESGCTDPDGNVVNDQCFNENTLYGDIKVIGNKSYRALTINSSCSAYGWSSNGFGYPYCESYGSEFSGLILLELEKTGNVIEKDIYTGFMIVEAIIQAENNSIETYYGSLTKDGYYILESDLGNENRLKIN
jgi:hypothetical protein